MLWRIQQIESRRAQLIADGEVIANDVEATSWGARAFQVIVCEACGVERCEAGGWVAPRAAGGSIVWLPAFEEMAESEADEDERRPPPYLTTRGIPVFDEGAAATLTRVAPGFPPMRELSPLSSREVALAMQWTAPASILGERPGAVRVREEDVLAVSSGDRSERMSELTVLLDRAAKEDALIHLEDAGERAERIDFYLDASGHPAWSPLVVVDGEARLHFDGLVATAAR